MKAFEIRLAKQQHANRAHLENLHRFISSDRFGLLPREQQDLMVEQKNAMAHLDHVLTQRMICLGLPCD